MKINNIKTILFPTDFSDGSMDALHYAVDITKRTNSKLVLLNVVDTPFNFNTENEPLDIDLVTSDLISLSKNNLDQIKNLIKKENAITVETVTYTGETTPSIVKASHNFRADLIIMDTKATKELFFNSTSYNIVKNTGVPTLTINEGGVLTSIKNILFPFNENFITLQKAEGAIQLAKLFNSSIVLLGISEANSPDKVESITNNMLIIKNIFDKNNIESEVHFSSSNDYSGVILSYCEQNKIDLVTVANDLKTAINESTKTSPTKKVINRSKIPVLTIPILR